MQRAFRIIAILTVGLLAIPAAAALPPEASFAGTWSGTLATSGGILRVVFHVTAQADGSWKATMDSPDQGASGIPMSKAVVDKNTLRLECRMIGGSFSGSLGKDGSVVGTWSQGGGNLPLVLKRVGAVEEAAPARKPSPPLPYTVDEVSYPSAEAGVTLAATLTVPEGGGPFPAVLLVPGSGPVDRDETIFGHKPFLALADYLTRRGIVVLRADKRGLGGSTGDLASSTDGDYVNDALGGVAYLKSRKEVKAGEIGIAGHSEGGLVASRAAAVSPDVAFIVLMAAPGLPGKQIILGQVALLLEASGADAATIKAKLALEERVLDTVIQEPDDAVAAKKLRALLEPELPPGAPAAALDGQLRGLLSPWYRDFLVFDPRPPLAKVRCPVLALAGEKDLQVAPGENLAAIRDALGSGGNHAVTVKTLPGLNHLFQPCTTGLPSEYGRIDVSFSPIALDAIGDWIVGLHGGA